MNFLKEAIDKLKSIGHDAKKVVRPVGRQKRKSFVRRLGGFIAKAAVKTMAAAGLVAASGVKNTYQSFTSTKTRRNQEQKTTRTRKLEPKKKAVPTARPADKKSKNSSKSKSVKRIKDLRATYPPRNTNGYFKSPSKKTVQARAKRDKEAGTLKAQQRYTTIATKTNTYYHEEREQELEKQQQIEDSQEPKPFSEPREQPDGSLEPVKTLTCQYTCCTGERNFIVTLNQLDWYYQKGLSDPKACYPCRKQRYDLLQAGEITGNCEVCSKPVTVSGEVWHMYLKNVGRPEFQLFCTRRGQHERDKEQAHVDQQLSKERADGITGVQGEHNKMRIAKKYRFLGNSKTDKEKRGELLKNKQKIEKTLEQGQCIPILDVPPDPDMEYYRNQGNAKETYYEHIDSHFTGVRPHDSEFQDNSLSEEFSSTEEAIQYAHYVAPLNNPQQFVDLEEANGCRIRFDLVKQLKIVYSSTTPRRVITMYKPNYIPRRDSDEDEITEDMKMMNSLGSDLNRKRKPKP